MWICKGGEGRREGMGRDGLKHNRQQTARERERRRSKTRPHGVIEWFETRKK